MLFRILVTGIFTGTLAAIAAFAHGYGAILSLLAYAGFGAMAVVGMGVLSLFAPKKPAPFHEWQLARARSERAGALWHPLAGPLPRKSVIWQDRLDRLGQNTPSKGAPAIVFSSVRSAQARSDAAHHR